MPDKTYTIDYDALKQPPVSDSPIHLGMYNSSDFIAVPIPPGHTHIECKSADSKFCMAPRPINTINGGFWLTLSKVTMARIEANPDSYKWVEGQPYPSSVVKEK